MVIDGGPMTLCRSNGPDCGRFHARQSYSGRLKPINHLRRQPIQRALKLFDIEHCIGLKDGGQPLLFCRIFLGA